MPLEELLGKSNKDIQSDRNTAVAILLVTNCYDCPRSQRNRAIESQERTDSKLSGLYRITKGIGYLLAISARFQLIKLINLFWITPMAEFFVDLMS